MPMLQLSYNMKILLTILLSFVFWSGTTKITQAQDESASSEAVVIEKKTDTTQEIAATQILENLEKLAKDETARAEINDQYNDVTTKNRGFVAKITSLKDDAFKIITPDGSEMFITPDKSTTIVKKGETTTGDDYVLTDWFAIDDWLVLIGVQNGETFSPRRILISSESLAAPQNFVIRGRVKTIIASKIDVVVVGDSTKSETFSLDKSLNMVNQNNETITYKDIAVDSQVLLVGSENSSNKKTLQTLRLL